MNQSKFRFAKIQLLSKERCFRNLNLSDTSSTSPSIAASSHFIATTSLSAGRVLVLPTDISKYDAKKSPLIAAHAGGVSDLGFTPFHADVLATGGDESIKLWKIPEDGFTSDVSKPEVEMKEMPGSVHSIQWNPLVDNLMAVGCKSALKICDVKEQKCLFSFDLTSYGTDLINVSWDYFGKEILCISKNYTMHYIDPRTKKEGTFGKGVKASGFRPQRAIFMGAGGKVLISGVSSSREPSLNIFDPRKLSDPLVDQQLSVSPGYLFPMYDHDTKILSLAIRGSNMVRLYDCAKAVKKSEIKPLSQKMLGFVVAGCCMAPKYALDVQQSEVIRLYSRDTSDVNPVSIRVPRKITGFHPELYPKTLSNHVYDLSCEAWVKGGNATPKLLAIDEKMSNFATISKGDSKETQQLGEKQEEKSETKEFKEEISDIRKKISSKLKRSAYVYLGGKQTTSKDKYFFDVKTGRPVNMQRNLALNKKFLAFPWKAIGGSAVAILPRDHKMGRIGDLPKVRGHSDQVTAFDLSILQPSKMATGAGEGVVKVWTIPENMKDDLKKEDCSLPCSGKILGLWFHPLVPDILLSASMGFEGCDMRVWNVKEEKEVSLINVHGETEVMSADWNVNGSLIVTTAKDHKVRVIDPRKNKVLYEFESQESARGTHAFFLDASSEIIACIGLIKGGERQVSVYDAKKGKCLGSKEIEGEAGAMMPQFDIDTGLLYVTAVGAPSIQFFLLATQTPYIEKLSSYKSLMGDFKGFVLNPKIECDVKKVEVAHGWQLSKDRLSPISFTVPRKRPEFFQDDLFVPTRSPKPLMDAATWSTNTDEKKEQAKYVSLQPAGMIPLSKAPKEKLTERELKYQRKKQEMAKPKPKGVLGHESAAEVRDHFRNLADMMDTSTNQWDAGGDDDDSDWSD
ncbi:hypothetical protein AAMO2058_000450700 [Amorphochlora amoebiformis]